jgi:histone H3/H4
MSGSVSDEAIFASILESMGIDEYDPLVTTALSEYARRYAASLISDAKDYAAHAGRTVS